MKALIINGKKVRLYESIDEMPIVNFQKYNKYLLIDAGIGSDDNDIDSHMVKIARYIKKDDKKSALQELQNLRQNLYMVNSELSPKYLAFAALVHSIDDTATTDLSDEGLKEVLAKLKEAKHSAVVEFLIWLKKKVSAELDCYFPNTFTNAKEKEAYDRLKKRTLLVLDTISNGSDNKDAIEEIDDFLLSMSKPHVFAGGDSAEVQYDKQFENMCLLIAQKSSLDAKKMTVLQFYSAIETIRKQMEAESKALNRGKRF